MTVFGNIEYKIKAFGQNKSVTKISQDTKSDQKLLDVLLDRSGKNKPTLKHI